MFNTLKILFITTGLLAIWVGPGTAFHLFGGYSGVPERSDRVLTQSADIGTQLPTGSSMELGDGGTIDTEEGQSMNIWIPGLGVVGKMPKLDFGLEMLYGASETQRDVPRATQELEEFETDFAIKGTIKRKF